MAESIANAELFKTLGFDNTSQWMFYDDQFTGFFKFLSENIHDENILSEREVLEQDELLESGGWLSDEARQLLLYKLNIEFPGLLSYTDRDIEDVRSEITYIERTIAEYIELIEDMRYTKHSLNAKIGNLQHTIFALKAKEQQLMSDCQGKAKQLEEIQRENYNLGVDAKRLFSKTQSPPLFIHQLPIDQYLLKTDSIMQYFSLYMKGNFKIQTITELNDDTEDLKPVKSQIEDLDQSMQYYTLALIKENAKVKAFRALIESLDLTQIHCLKLPDMVHETNELQNLNEHVLKNTHETLLNDLQIHVQQHTAQRLEMLIYENTKQKLERGLRRQENNLQITKIISEVLSNAELLWIAIQLDMEKIKNRCDNTEEMPVKAQACNQRINLMRMRNANCSLSSKQFLEKIATLLANHLGQAIRSDAKSCLYEYEKFGRLISYALNGMLNKKPYSAALELLSEFKRVECLLQPYVYDSPVRMPMFVNVRYLRQIFDANISRDNIQETIRNLRSQFKLQVTERMERDKLWRYKQLLWIWFLTDPPRMLHAIEEAKKGSAKMAAIPNFKPQIGSNRMNPT